MHGRGKMSIVRREMGQKSDWDACLNKAVVLGERALSNSLSNLLSDSHFQQL